MSTYPLVVVPGLFGSVLRYEAPDPTQSYQVWPTDSSSTAVYLRCTDQGQATYPDIAATRIDVGYDKMFSWLTTLGYSQAKGNLVKMPYDWRLDLETVVGSDTSDQKISGQLPLARRIADAAGASKVDILCHSMGCLATLVYLMKYGFGRIHRIIFLAPPLLGTVEAYYRITCGIGPSAARKIDATTWATLFKNMMGVHQICPGQTLTQLLDSSFLALTNATIQKRFPQNFQQSYDLAPGQIHLDPGMNFSLLQAAGQWRQKVDSWLQSSANLIGSYGYVLYGVLDASKVSHLELVYDQGSSGVLPKSYTVGKSTGDQNVLTAGLTDLPALGFYEFDGCTHMQIANHEKTMRVAVEILKGNPPATKSYKCLV